MNNIIQESVAKRKIIELLLKYPNREFTINELAKLSKIPYASSWRFVQELDKAGVIEVKTIGHSRVCRLNEASPFLKEIKKVLKAKPTPQKTVIEDFVKQIRGLKQIKRIILFGSVARDQEDLTSDVDIAVIVGKKNKVAGKKVADVASKILEESRIAVVPVMLTEKELKENKQFDEELSKGKVLYERTKRS